MDRVTEENVIAALRSMMVVMTVVVWLLKLPISSGRWSCCINILAWGTGAAGLIRS